MRTKFFSDLDAFYHRLKYLSRFLLEIYEKTTSSWPFYLHKIFANFQQFMARPANMLMESIP